MDVSNETGNDHTGSNASCRVVVGSFGIGGNVALSLRVRKAERLHGYSRSLCQHAGLCG